MAYVTRCPYCGSVWLMPDKETDRTREVPGLQSQF